MSSPILRLEIRVEHDVVLARQRARQVAGLLGFEAQDQTRIATAVSEIARNAFQYAGGGTVEFLADGGKRSALVVRISDRGPGIKDLQTILDGRYQSATGMGLGIVGVRRLMDQFRVESSAGAGTAVEFAKGLPRHAPPVTPQGLARVAEGLARHGPESPFEEVRQQNQELLQALEELRLRQEELSEANAALTQLNRELEETNRGVVALYAELDEKADFLRRASETKSRFLSNMSHEFRTPLNAITGLARLLLDRIDGELTAEQEKQVTLIRRASEDLTELVSDLLDLARVEAGKVIVRPSEFEVAGLFGALRGMLRPLLAANTSVALVFEEPAGLPPLNTDESKVSQILRNFISNALKFTERGEVRVTARPGPDDTVEFAVADTGIGIPPEHHERIFEEFAQVESSRQKFVKGTGLGLPLVRRLVGLLGGRLHLTSEPGVGSTFSAVLPRAYTGPAEVAFVPEVTSHVDPARRPVLVVEDNAETLFIYEKYLKGTDFQVIPARTLPAARAALGRFRPAAVILDVLLEGESTWELLGELKAGQATRDLPVLVVTVVENEAKARALGADAFCAKPVDRTWLLGRLSAPPAASGKLLLIDDDEASRYLLRGLLAETGREVIEAADADEGLRAAVRERPRAIFLDLGLPDRSGFELLDVLRAEPATRDIPVIINTSKPIGEDERRRLLKSGAVAVLPKDQPSREASLARLRDALRGAGLREGAAT